MMNDIAAPHVVGNEGLSRWKWPGYVGKIRKCKKCIHMILDINILSYKYKIFTTVAREDKKYIRKRIIFTT